MIYITRVAIKFTYELRNEGQRVQDQRVRCALQAIQDLTSNVLQIVVVDSCSIPREMQDTLTLTWTKPFLYTPCTACRAVAVVQCMLVTQFYRTIVWCVYVYRLPVRVVSCAQVASRFREVDRFEKHKMRERDERTEKKKEERSRFDFHSFLSLSSYWLLLYQILLVSYWPKFKHFVYFAFLLFFFFLLHFGHRTIPYTVPTCPSTRSACACVYIALRHFPQVRLDGHLFMYFASHCLCLLSL